MSTYTQKLIEAINWLQANPDYDEGLLRELKEKLQARLEKEAAQ